MVYYLLVEQQMDGIVGTMATLIPMMSLILFLINETNYNGLKTYQGIEMDTIPTNRLFGGLSKESRSVFIGIIGHHISHGVMSVKLHQYQVIQVHPFIIHN